jgi:hypothetical protein
MLKLMGRGENRVERIALGFVLSIVLLALAGCHSEGSDQARESPGPTPGTEGNLSPPPATLRPLVDHSVWDDFLQTYVQQHESGIHRIDYGAVQKVDRAGLAAYVEDLSATEVSVLPGAEQKIFWINLYNALTIKVILDHFPVASIIDIDLSPTGDGPWDAKLISVQGKELSLNDIEHGILRPRWQDNRIHYAVNCASLGCPNLATEAFSVENSERLLEAGARDFINHRRGARFEAGQLVVSNIFLWYKEDFGASDQGVVLHLRQYAAGELAVGLAAYEGSLRGDYDWSLNGYPVAGP